jgi:hypothetical protein
MLRSTCLLTAATLLACDGPLPPENPKTEVDQRAELMPIIGAGVEPSASASAAAPVALPAAVVFADIGLKTPESVLYDPASDLYLVSNIDGSPDGKDGQAILSQLEPEGGVKELHWILSGKNGVTLDAPKGSALSGGKLWLSDIDQMRRFDAATGRLEKSIPIPGSTFLNDVVAAADGTIYVTDTGVKVGKEGFEPTGTDAIYEIKKDKVRSVAQGTNLGRPNGIVLVGQNLSFVTMGANQLHEMDVKGTILRSVSTPKGMLDGLVRLSDDDFLISSWEGSAVYRGGFVTPPVEILSEERSPADFGFDSKRNRLLIPVFLHDQVRAVDLPPAPSPAAASQAAAPQPAAPQPAASQSAAPSASP